jgi:hypothetical protein
MLARNSLFGQDQVTILGPSNREFGLIDEDFTALIVAAQAD